MAEPIIEESQLVPVEEFFIEELSTEEVPLASPSEDLAEEMSAEILDNEQSQSVDGENGPGDGTNTF